MQAMEKLLEVSSLATGEGAVPINDELPPDLRQLLTLKNGFFAFESALEVFPATKSSKSYSIHEWNRENLWKCYYSDLMPFGVCFAQDIFGNQFIYSDSIYKFEAETAELSFLALSVDIFAQLILEDYNFLTGYPLARAWQELHGRVPFFHRLVPFAPFVLGGEYEVNNLDVLGSSESMIARANLACQIKELPDGSKIMFEIDD